MSYPYRPIQIWVGKPPSPPTPHGQATLAESLNACSAIKVVSWNVIFEVDFRNNIIGPFFARSLFVYKFFCMNLAKTTGHQLKTFSVSTWHAIALFTRWPFSAFKKNQKVPVKSK